MDKYNISGKIGELLDIAVSNLSIKDKKWLIDKLATDLE